MKTFLTKLAFLIGLGFGLIVVLSFNSLWAQTTPSYTNQVNTNQVNTNQVNTNQVNTNQVNTNQFNPFSTIFILALDAGINLYILDEEATIEKYQLDDLQDTLSFTYNIKLGVVLQYHWMVLLAYHYSKREDYLYSENYFNVNQKSIEFRQHYSLQFQFDYFLWNYLDDRNVSFGAGVGWLRKNIQFNTIGDYNSSEKLLSSTKVSNYDFAITSIGTKFYHRLRETGTIYFGAYYNLMIPTLENYPHFVLGIDVNFDLTPEPPKNTNPFFEDEPGPVAPEDRTPRTVKPKTGIKSEVQKGATQIFKGAQELKRDVEGKEQPE